MKNVLFIVHQQLPFSSLISTTYRKIEIQFVFKEDLFLLNTKQLSSNYGAITTHVCSEIPCFS